MIATGSSPAYPAAWTALGDRLVTNETCSNGRPAGKRRGVRPRRHRPRARPGAASAGRARQGVRSRRRRRTAVRSGARRGSAARLRRRVLSRHRRACGRGARRRPRRRFATARSTARREPSTSTTCSPQPVARPTSRKLGLERTSVALDARGVPLFDRETMQCGDSPIFIAGDANDDVPLLHEAADEGRIAGDNAARFPAVHAGAAPQRRSRVVFTDPQIAIVGGGWRDVRDTAHVTGERVVRRPGTRARDATQPRAAARLCRNRHRTPARRGDDRPDAEHLGASARVGAPAEAHRRADAARCRSTTRSSRKACARRCAMRIRKLDAAAHTLRAA